MCAAVLISIASVVSRVGGGYLLDYTSERFVMSLGMVVQAVSMALMGYLTPTTARIAAFIQGASGGIMMNVTAVAYANFFGGCISTAAVSLPPSLFLISPFCLSTSAFFFPCRLLD